MITGNETTEGVIIPADILARLEEEARPKKDYTLTDTVIMSYYPKLSGAAISRALGHPHDKEVLARIKILKKSGKI